MWKAGTPRPLGAPPRAAVAAVASSAAIVGLFAGGATARPAVKAFAPGCWKGTGMFTGSVKKGNLTAKVTNGKMLFALRAGTGPTAAAIGSMDASGHGSGSLDISGTEIAMEIAMTGEYSLHGTPAKVKVSGTGVWKGVALYNGASFPIDLKLPIENAPLTILTAGPTHASGTFGTAKWSAIRISAAGLQKCIASVFK